LADGRLCAAHSGRRCHVVMNPRGGRQGAQSIGPKMILTRVSLCGPAGQRWREGIFIGNVIRNGGGRKVGRGQEGRPEEEAQPEPWNEKSSDSVHWQAIFKAATLRPGPVLIEMRNAPIYMRPASGWLKGKGPRPPRSGAEAICIGVQHISPVGGWNRLLLLVVVSCD
jgi:hypothetical protein